MIVKGQSFFFREQGKITSFRRKEVENEDVYFLCRSRYFNFNVFHIYNLWMECFHEYLFKICDKKTSDDNICILTIKELWRCSIHIYQPPWYIYFLTVHGKPTVLECVIFIIMWSHAWKRNVVAMFHTPNR